MTDTDIANLAAALEAIGIQLDAARIALGKIATPKPKPNENRTVILQ